MSSALAGESLHPLFSFCQLLGLGLHGDDASDVRVSAKCLQTPSNAGQIQILDR